MKNISVIGIDLAKNTFALCAMTAQGKVVWRKSLKRSLLAEFAAQHPTTLIAFEACGGSHFWARQFANQGHQVKMMSVVRVKPFAPPHKKNDPSDAEAIALAALQDGVPSVRVKGIEQQDIDILLNYREQLMKQRVAQVNQAHAIALEYGVMLPAGKSVKRLEDFFEHLEDASNHLTEVARSTIQKLLKNAKQLNDEANALEVQLSERLKGDSNLKLLKSIPGVGALTAAAILAHTGADVRSFKNGRQFAAYLGLVPRQYSTGGKTRLGGVTKSGSETIRRLLVIGTRSVINRSERKKDKVSQWISEKRKTRGYLRANLALANKTARIVFAVLKHQEKYRTTA